MRQMTFTVVDQERHTQLKALLNDALAFATRILESFDEEDRLAFARIINAGGALQLRLCLGGVSPKVEAMAVGTHGETVYLFTVFESPPTQLHS